MWGGSQMTQLSQLQNLQDKMTRLTLPIKTARLSGQSETAPPRLASDLPRSSVSNEQNDF